MGARGTDGSADGGLPFRDEGFRVEVHFVDSRLEGLGGEGFACGSGDGDSVGRVQEVVPGELAAGEAVVFRFEVADALLGDVLLCGEVVGFFLGADEGA